MAEEFASADVFCLPSLAEGMARATLEALANGLPCVVTRASGAPITNGKEGLLVPERDGPAIAEAIATIVEDRDRRNHISEAALRRARDHTPDQIADTLYSTLTELVDL